MNAPPERGAVAAAGAAGPVAGALRVGERIVLTLWVGSLWTVGYLVAPTLFATLEDRALAGTIAGRLFRIESWLGLACGLLLLLAWLPRRGLRDMAVRAVLVMVALTAAGEFVLHPAIAAARGDPEASFALLHGASSLLYLATSAIGLFLVAGGAAGREA